VKERAVIKPYEREFFVPTPSRATLFLRTFVPWQLLRFAWINLKMLRMIGIGHHGRVPLRPVVEPGADTRAAPEAAPPRG
jgi:hypothetical protein